MNKGGRNGKLDPRNGNEEWRNLGGDELYWLESGTFMIYGAPEVSRKYKTDQFKFNADIDILNHIIVAKNRTFQCKIND